MKSMFLFASLLTLMFGALIVSMGPQDICRYLGYDDTMEELVKDIDNGKDNDDDMNWNESRFENFQTRDIEHKDA